MKAFRMNHRNKVSKSKKLKYRVHTVQQIQINIQT